MTLLSLSTFSDCRLPLNNQCSSVNRVGDHGGLGSSVGIIRRAASLKWLLKAGA